MMERWEEYWIDCCLSHECTFCVRLPLCELFFIALYKFIFMHVNNNVYKNPGGVELGVLSSVLSPTRTKNPFASGSVYLRARAFEITSDLLDNMAVYFL